MTVQKMAKGAFGVLVVVVLFMLVVNWIGDYRASIKPGTARSGETTGSATATSTANATESPQPQTGAGTQVLIVQVQGLNFRQKPSGSARAYRGLAQGEKVVVISKEGEWYKVRDSGGTVGYITSNPTYTKPAQ